MSRHEGACVRTATWRWKWAAGVALLLAPAGCSLRHDPGFNPYSRGDGYGTLMDRAERAVEAAGQHLDSLDARLENSVW